MCSYAKLKGALADANETYLGGKGNAAVMSLVAGGSAGALATSISYPLDLLRTRLASYTGSITGALQRETIAGMPCAVRLLKLPLPLMLT